MRIKYLHVQVTEECRNAVYSREGIEECGIHIHIGVRSNSILGGPNIIYTAIAAICAACINTCINKVSRVKHWRGPGPPAPLVPMPMVHYSVD